MSHATCHFSNLLTFPFQSNQVISVFFKTNFYGIVRLFNGIPEKNPFEKSTFITKKVLLYLLSLYADPKKIDFRLPSKLQSRLY